MKKQSVREFYENITKISLVALLAIMAKYVQAIVFPHFSVFPILYSGFSKTRRIVLLKQLSSRRTFPLEYEFLDTAVG